ncbi:hypothetical protein Rctr197k_005 [Virus Rctr197k]|nr:hypothetical protein Rctr197k_005 [Virus Rctr197k]
MKKIDPTIIEKGALLLDTATWPEFATFLQGVMMFPEAVEILSEELKALLDAGQRPRAIALWRKAVETHQEALFSRMSPKYHAAVEMVKSSGIKTLSPRQLQIASSIFGALLATASNKDMDTDTVLLLFGAAVVNACLFENAATLLGVKLP